MKMHGLLRTIGYKIEIYVLLYDHYKMESYGKMIQTMMESGPTTRAQRRAAMIQYLNQFKK